MARKSFNEKLQDSKDMPKIVEVTDEKSVERYGGTQMLIAPPLEYSELMSEIPEGKVITIKEIREFLAKSMMPSLHVRLQQEYSSACLHKPAAREVMTGYRSGEPLNLTAN